ncbi:MAG: TlpA disulfide reductase family protein [Akkermansia sp.]|nr:TlpA disulfide reductase family protein [Akkermansia sp.]
MKKHTFFYLMMALGLCLATPAAYSADSKDKTEEAAPATSAVGKAIEEITFITDKRPSTSAKYYIYLQSASWCGPCNAEMPHVVKAYKAMKGKKVELILVGSDKTEDEAKGFMKKYKADFPCILKSDPQARKLPGFKPASGIPNAAVVDAEGKEIVNTHAGEVIKNWKKYTKK